MKTAKEWVLEFLPETDLDSQAEIETMMQNYAYLVAKETLKNASKKAKIIKTGNSGSYFDASVDVNSIIETPILTP